MVADLLDLSRLQGGAMSFAIDRHDLSCVARLAVGELSTMANARRIGIDMEAPAEPVLVECDETLLLRAIENLLSNAIRYSPVGGRVRMEVALGEAEMAVLVVQDEGPGIPDEHKARIFERFYRVDPKRKGGPGTGIGLAIAKSIVDGHAGTIRVEDAPGGGSRFVVELHASRALRKANAGTASSIREVAV
jgi:signal transduction histidine kinase